MNTDTFFEHFDSLIELPGGVAKVRELILQLAVQGKLVEQDERDEPAEVSIERVSQDAKKAIRDGTIHRYGLEQALEDADLAGLPFGWRWTRLVEVTRPVQYAIKRGPFGSAIRKDMFVPTGFKVYEQQHAISGDFKKGRYYINEAKFEELRAFELHPGEILVSCSGTVGKVSIVPADIERGIINQALLKLSLHQSALLNEYFLILFPAFFMETDTLTNLSGTAQKNIPGMDVLKAMPFPLPPLAEQRRIVAKVDQLMALCDELETRQERKREGRERLVESSLAKLLAARDPADFAEHWHRVRDSFDLAFDTQASVPRLRQTLLQLAVHGRLLPQVPSDEPVEKLVSEIEEFAFASTGISRTVRLVSDAHNGAIPNGWIVVPFGDITVNRDGERVPLSRSIREGRKGKYPYYGASGIIDSIDAFIYDKPLLLIGEDGANLINRSTPIAFIATGEYWVNNHAHVLDCVSMDVLRYLELFINAINLEPYVTGTAQPKMNQAKMNAIPVLLPPVDEQRRIVAKSRELMALCDQLEKQLDETQVAGERLLASSIASLLAATAG